jgi:hypothetical protein
MCLLCFLWLYLLCQEIKPLKGTRITKDFPYVSFVLFCGST